MNLDGKFEDLQARTLMATKKAENAQQPQTTRLASGTLWVLPPTAAHPVEWLIVDTTPAKRLTALLLVVPVDTHPLLGEGDFEVPADKPGGPLSVRSLLAFWVEEGAFRQARFTGQVEADAATWVRQELVGSDAPSLLQEDAESDPEYFDWRQQIEKACEILSRWRVADPVDSAVPARRLPPRRLWMIAAAVLLSTSVATLSWFNVDMSRELRQFSNPTREPTIGELAFSSSNRFGTDLELAVPASWFQLIFLLPKAEAGSQRIEIRDGRGAVLWNSSVFSTEPELTVNLARSKFPPGVYSVRLYAVDPTGFEEHQESRRLEIRQ